MKALVIESYQSNLIRAMQGIRLAETTMPEVGENEILVKVEMAPVNPSDIAFLRGGYQIKKSLPAVPGFEGTGLIERVGKNLQQNLAGKRVSFFAQGDSGSWAEYAVIGLSDFIEVNEKIPPEQAACLFVNPFTAYALVNHIIENGHTALIQSAAMGQIGQFIRFFAKLNNLKVINLVRKETHIDLLRNEGAQYVLNINHPNFADDLKHVACETRTTAALDAVGGELTGKILNSMPDGSEVILYGGLSGLSVGQIDPLEVIFKNKVLRGFNLGDWLNNLSTKEFSEISSEIQQLFVQQNLATRIQQVFSLENFYTGLRSYISDMSNGKILFSMSQKY
ncbi:MAG: hypothetical protein EOM06_07105 [Sphingobacteriia bacterium]|nr:hypothetical protein [Sphingobacteriia bacterium]